MRIKSFEFNMRELAGSMGDFGTLFPLAIGYMVVCGLNPTGLLVMMGVANIVSGLVYRLPMPVEPMKILAASAIAQGWGPFRVYASAFTMGIIWIMIALTGSMKRLSSATPRVVVRGVQVALGISLAWQALPMLNSAWVLGLVSIVIIVAFRENRYAPAAVILMILGGVRLAAGGGLAGLPGPHFTLPEVTLFPWREIWPALVSGGFAQIPLTAANAIIATTALIHHHWPERTDITEQQLALNHGVMNLVAPFFGGMPMCHGAGGLAGQHFFGARTGGTNLIEGTIEITLGLFFSGLITAFFSGFPRAIIGAMMLLVGVEMVRFAREIRNRSDWAAAGVTIVLALLTNMAVGFVAGLVCHHGLRWIKDKKTGVGAGC